MVYMLTWHRRQLQHVLPGVHFLVEQMNKYTQSECDDACTATGEAHLGSEQHPYVVLHKVSGQQEVIESILRPVAHGFQKRFWVAFAHGRRVIGFFREGGFMGVGTSGALGPGKLREP